jgi:dynactin complex subunit
MESQSLRLNSGFDFLYFCKKIEKENKMEDIKFEKEEVTQENEVTFEEMLEEIIERAVVAAVERTLEAVKQEREVVLNGAVFGEMGRESPDKRVDFSKLSYSELCAFLERNPKMKLGRRK